MAADADLAIIAEQEQKLVFDQFNEDTAFAIGGYVREAAKAIGKGVAVGVYLWDRTLFYGATAGASEGNRGWAERKAKLVRLQLKSSYRIVLERGDRPRLLEEITTLEDYRTRHAQYKSDPDLQEAHRLHPWIVVWDDHEFARSAIARAMGLDPTAYALPPV